MEEDPKIIREPTDGWLIRMNDEVGTRACAGSMFRFGRRSMDGNYPVVETYQPGWAVGTRYFVPFADEQAVRTFLLGLGFTECRRVTPDTTTPEWSHDSPP